MGYHAYCLMTHIRSNINFEISNRETESRNSFEKFFIRRLMFVPIKFNSHTINIVQYNIGHNHAFSD